MQNKGVAVGVTGGIGSGKSLVCKVFETLGVPVYYADARAKWLQAHHKALVEAIKAHFGAEAYKADGTLNRTFVAGKVFNDQEQLKALNGLVHPYVAEDFQQWQQTQPAPYVIKEAALLFETGSYAALQKIINVNAPAELRIRRVLLRDPQRSWQQVVHIMEKQWTDKARSQKADFNIDNGGQSLIVPEVLSIHQKLLSL